VFSTIFSASNDLIVIVIAVVVLFGGTQLPKLARNAGQAMKEFRKGHDDEASADAGAAPAGQATAAQPSAVQSTAPAVPVVPVISAQPVVPAQPAALTPGQVTAATAPADERITMTRAQLDALLADNEARAQAAKGEGTDAQS
jgi:sec-independent protein translocase protein TatA